MCTICHCWVVSSYILKKAQIIAFFTMKALLIFAAIIGLGASTLLDTIPEAYWSTVNKCLEQSEMPIEKIEVECSKLEYQESCGCLAFCIGKEMEVMFDDGTMDVDMMIEKSLQAAKDFNLNVEDSRIVNAIKKCVNEVQEDWDNCRKAGELTICAIKELPEIMDL